MVLFLKKAVVIFSGGIDSICTCLFLKSKYNLYGISFSYGQRASREIKIAKSFSKILGLKEHRILDISFMKNLYGKTNVLTNSKDKIPQKFDRGYHPSAQLHQCYCHPTRSYLDHLSTA